VSNTLKDDFYTSLIIAKIDICQYELEVWHQVLKKMGEAKGYTEESTKNPPHQPTNQPNQNVTEPTTTPNFDHLPWRSYKTKQAATTEENAWIFTNTSSAETLLKTIKDNNEKSTIGAFEYILTGPEKQFITRKPVKTKGEP